MSTEHHHQAAQGGSGLELRSALIVIGVFLAVKEVFEMYLAFRQLRKVETVRDPPKELAAVMDKEELAKSNAYASDRLRFGMIRSVWATALLVIEIYYGLWPLLWNLSFDIGTKISGGRMHEAGKAHSIVFFLLQSQIGKVLSLPWDLYSTFVIEQRHGFNKQTIGLFVADMLKGLVLEVVFSIIIVSLVIGIVEWAGDQFYLYLTVAAAVLNMIMMWVVPNFIQPLFNKFTPLEEGPVREGINALAQRVKFPLTKVFVMDVWQEVGTLECLLLRVWALQAYRPL